MSTFLLGYISVSFPEMRVTARKEARDVEKANGAVDGTVSASKKLMAGVDAHKYIKDWRNTALRDWRTVTLPWYDGKVPVRAFNANIALQLRQQNADWEEEYFKRVDLFMPQYPAIRAQRQFEMGTLFSEREFPAPDALRARFRWSCPTWTVCPDPNDLRLVQGLDQAEVDAMIVSARQEEEQRIANAVGCAAKRLYEVVVKLKEKLDIKIGDEGAVFRDSKLDNIIEIVNLMPAFNITNDKQLADLAVQARSLVTTPADQLRTDAEQRAKTAEKAQALAEKLSGLFTADTMDDDE